MELPSGFLMLPRSGERTLPALRKKLALLALHTLLTLPPARAGRVQGPFARFQTWLERTARSPERAELVTALGHVETVAPSLVLRVGDLEPGELLAELVPTLLLALSRARPAGFSERLLWDVPVRRVLDPATGRALGFDPPAKGLLAEGDRIELRTATGGWDISTSPPPESVREERAFFPLSEAAAPLLTLADANPLFMLEEHPEKSGNAVSLGERSAEEWCGALGEALELVRVCLPELHREMLQTLERVVPVGYEPERHLSASYREAPGLVYLTLHPSPLTLAEALVHETQHGKLNALSWFDAVLENAQTTWTPSPVRPDLRPLWGVLLAVHAFVPVAALHLRLAELDHPLSHTDLFARRRADVLSANRDGLATLQRLAKPTDAGRRVLDAVSELHRRVVEASPTTSSDATVTALG